MVETWWITFYWCALGTFRKNTIFKSLTFLFHPQKKHNTYRRRTAQQSLHLAHVITLGDLSCIDVD